MSTTTESAEEPVHLWRLVFMRFGDDPVDEYRCELCPATKQEHPQTH